MYMPNVDCRTRKKSSFLVLLSLKCAVETICGKLANIKAKITKKCPDCDLIHSVFVVERNIFSLF